MTSIRDCLILILMAVLMFGTPEATAQTTPVRSLPDETCGGAQTIYFGNGVHVLPEQAHESMRAAVPRIEAASPLMRYATKYAIAYNSTSGLLVDLSEAALLKLGTYYVSNYDRLIGYALGIDSLQAPAAVIADFNLEMLGRLRNLVLLGPISSFDLDRQVSQFKADLARARKVVVIAHSQGNQFANLALSQLSLEEANSFSIVPVASPVVVRKTFVRYVTFTDDNVIRFVLGAPAGDYAAQPPNGWTNHFFGDDYMADTRASQDIVENVVQTVLALPSPSSTLCPIMRLTASGVITSVTSNVQFPLPVSASVGSSYLTFLELEGGNSSVPIADGVWWLGSVRRIGLAVGGGPVIQYRAIPNSSYVFANTRAGTTSYYYAQGSSDTVGNQSFGNYIQLSSPQPASRSVGLDPTPLTLWTAREAGFSTCAGGACARSILRGSVNSLTYSRAP